ncbi:putative secreted RxLR effector protein [Phytophthora cinnamomi]|uniref:putative secreted RxLR effector protein n=1 Tax=Phytophthora cinnamomi TaxID=4785 RepID=UPI002B2842BE|nr:putative secreted RxLR effector protein [Phytophthora cinnamomi]QVE55519.1 RxLR effector protein 5a [Phytophthora cinnamomi]
MCVYLAPRWRRRSLLATLMVALALLLTADAARALRTSIGAKQQTGSNTGSGSAAVQVEVGDVEAGVVSTDTTQSSTTFTKKTWGAGSYSGTNKKSVSFASLVQTQEPKLASSASGATDDEVGTPSATTSPSKSTNSKGSKDAKQGDDDDSYGSFDLESDDGSADSCSNSKAHDKTTGKTGTSKTWAPTPTSASEQTKYTPPTTHPGTIEIKSLSWSEPTLYPQTTQPGPYVAGIYSKPTSGSASSASGQPVQGQSYGVLSSANAPETLEKSTKSAASTTSSKSLDETLVLVIVGVVGAIGALLMFVSRKVLQETGDDRDLANSSFF